MDKLADELRYTPEERRELKSEIYDILIQIYCIKCTDTRPDWATGAKWGCGKCEEPEIATQIAEENEYCSDCGVPLAYLRVNGPKYMDKHSEPRRWWCSECRFQRDPVIRDETPGQITDEQRKRQSAKVEMRPAKEIERSEQMCNDLLTDENDRGIFPRESKEATKWIEARGRWTQVEQGNNAVFRWSEGASSTSQDKENV